MFMHLPVSQLNIKPTVVHECNIFCTQQRWHIDIQFQHFLLSHSPSGVHLRTIICTKICRGDITLYNTMSDLKIVVKLISILSKMLVESMSLYTISCNIRTVSGTNKIVVYPLRQKSCHRKQTILHEVTITLGARCTNKPVQSCTFWLKSTILRTVNISRNISKTYHVWAYQSVVHSTKYRPSEWTVSTTLHLPVNSVYHPSSFNSWAVKISIIMTH